MERRRQYRVDSGEVEGLQTSLRTSTGSVFSGQPLDLSVDGMAIRFLSLGFALPGASPLLVGDEVELRLALPQLEKPLAAPARVIHRADQEDSRRYGFRFTDRQQLESQLSPALYRFLNRRAAYRVKPAPDSPIEVTLTGTPGGSRARARLLDISAGGMGLRVPLQAESALSATDRIKVSLSLPNCIARLNLGINIRNRRLVGAEVYYGAEFDLGRTPEAQRQLDAVIAFVMERQRALLGRPSGPLVQPQRIRLPDRDR